MEPAIKGLSFVSCVETIRKHADSFDRFVEALSPATRARVLQLPGANEWVPLEHIEHTMHVAYEHAYARSLERCFDHGREGVKRDVRGIYSVFVRAFSPEFTLRRVANMWRTYYRENGELGMRAFDPAQRIFELEWRNTRMTSPEFWAFTVGVVQGVAEVVRLRDIRVRIVAGGAGKSWCVCRGEWNA